MKHALIAGVDEAGRGPLAGPVVACALVSLNQGILSLTKDASLVRLRIKDSKHLNEKQREEYYRVFQKHPGLQWGIGKVSQRMIERINIYQATRLAMERAVTNLSKKVTPDFLYVDGTMTLGTAIPQKAVVRGDETVPLCAMASIIAKVTRDHLMVRYHKLYPQYGFLQHKGYGTKHHRAMLQKYGVCRIHRRSFSPVKFEIRASKLETNSKF